MVNTNLSSVCPGTTLVWWCFFGQDSLLHNTAPVQVYLSLLWVQSTLVIADTVQGSELVSLLVRVCNSGSLFQSNACNLFLPGT